MTFETTIINEIAGNLFGSFTVMAIIGILILFGILLLVKVNLNLALIIIAPLLIAAGVSGIVGSVGFTVLPQAAVITILFGIALAFALGFYAIVIRGG